MNWDLIETLVIAAVLCAIAAGWILLIMFRIAFLEVMAHPSVQALVRVANKFGKGGPGQGLLEKGVNWLMSQK